MSQIISPNFSAGLCLAYLSLSCLVSGQSSETRAITGKFDGLVVNGPFSVAITFGSENSVKLTGPAEQLKNIETSVRDNDLRLRWNVPTDFNGAIQIQVTAKLVTTIVSASSAQITCDPINEKLIRIVIAQSSSVNGTFTGDNLSVVVYAFAKFSGKLAMTNFNAVVSESGTMTVTGSAQTANIVVNGKASFRGANFAAQSLSTTVSGVARADVNGVVELKASLSDSAVVRYVGSPKLTSETLGLSKLEKLTVA